MEYVLRLCFHEGDLMFFFALAEYFMLIQIDISCPFYILHHSMWMLST